MNLQTFVFNASPVRVIQRNGSIWFSAKDTCSLLDLVNVGQAISSLEADDKIVLNHGDLVSMGLIQSDDLEITRLAFVSEPGLYALVFKSQKPGAHAFKRWITHEVLPAIRKTGTYQVAPAWDIPKTYAGALALAARQAEELDQKTEAIAVLEPKAAFCDAVSRAQDGHSVIEAAKILGVGQNCLFDRLRGWGYLFRDGRTHLPYQQHVASGLFRVVEEHYEDTHGRDRIYPKVLVTGKGMVAIQRKIAADFPVALVRPQHQGRA